MSDTTPADAVKNFAPAVFDLDNYEIVDTWNREHPHEVRGRPLFQRTKEEVAIWLTKYQINGPQGSRYAAVQKPKLVQGDWDAFEMHMLAKLMPKVLGHPTLRPALSSVLPSDLSSICSTGTPFTPRQVVYVVTDTKMKNSDGSDLYWNKDKKCYGLLSDATLYATPLSDLPDTTSAYVEMIPVPRLQTLTVGKDGYGRPQTAQDASQASNPPSGTPEIVPEPQDDAQSPPSPAVAAGKPAGPVVGTWEADGEAAKDAQKPAGPAEPGEAASDPTATASRPHGTLALQGAPYCHTPISRWFEASRTDKAWTVQYVESQGYFLHRFPVCETADGSSAKAVADALHAAGWVPPKPVMVVGPIAGEIKAETPAAQSTPAVGLLENTAAIGAELHGSTKRYDKFYDLFGEALDGFPGIWKFCVTMAKVFTAVEAETKSCPKVDPTTDWIAAIEAYVDTVMADAIKQPGVNVQSPEFLKPRARAAIEGARDGAARQKTVPGPVVAPVVAPAGYVDDRIPPTNEALVAAVRDGHESFYVVLRNTYAPFARDPVRLASYLLTEMGNKRQRGSPMTRIGSLLGVDVGDDMQGVGFYKWFKHGQPTEASLIYDSVLDVYTVASPALWRNHRLLPDVKKYWPMISRAQIQSIVTVVGIVAGPDKTDKNKEQLNG